MFSGMHLMPARRLLATALSVAVLGVVSPAWAQQSDDDDATGDKNDVRVYRMGHDDTDQGNWKDDSDNDRDNDPGDKDDDSGDREDNDNNGGQTHVYRYKVERTDAKGGYLGVQVQDITRSLMKARDLPSDEGALVNRIEDQSPADEAGMQRGDVIVEVNQKSIQGSQDLIETMRDTKPGSKIEVTVLRDGARKTLKVEVANRPKGMMMAGPGFQMRGMGMDPQQRQELQTRLREMDPEKMGQMRMMVQGPEFRQQLDELRKEVDALKDELRDLKQELRDSKGSSRSGGHSGH